MGLRAQRKKMAKKFRVGDIVTWGRCTVNLEVIEVTPEGVYVRVDSTRRHFVPFVWNPKSNYDDGLEPLKLVRRP